MKKALINNGQIQQFEANAFNVAPGLFWVDAPDDATIDTHIYDGTVVKVKPPKTKEELDAEANAVIDKAQKSIMTPDVMGDLLIFVASLNGAPQSIKTAANLIATEKAKKPK